MAQISITVDGAALKLEADQRPTHIFADNKEVVVCRVNGALKDLWTELSDGDVVESIVISSPDGLAVLRHSTAHVMAQAVQEVYANTRLGIGPPIKDGFYYDFDPVNTFNPDDLVKIESAMRKIVKEGQRFRRRVTTEADALKELAHEPYKCELIGIKGPAGEEASVEVGGSELTIYDNLGRDGNPVWSDLCRGPHLPSTKHIPAFKLMRTAAAYWRGSEKNPMLQRIYGTAWPSQDELNAYLELLAEAEKRDHRRLGTELDLFSFSDELPDDLLIVSLRAPYEMGHGGYAWYAIDLDSENNKFSDLVQARESMHKIAAAIDDLKNQYNTNLSNTFLLGFSQGAILSYALSLNFPNKIQHVIALSGYLNKELIPNDIDQKISTDYYISHGSVDQVIPVEWARNTTPFLETLKLQYEYSEYPVGHGVSPQNFFSFKKWIENRL